MNCGLSNLTTLKGFILPVSMQAQTSYDVKLQTVGLLVLEAFNAFCNRRLEWNAAAEDIFTGDRPQWYVRHFPIGTIPNTSNDAPMISAVNMRYFLTDNWTDIVGEPLQVDASKGKIHFGYTLGRAPLQVQVLYSGGYWFQTGEGTESDPTIMQPSGSVALPSGLQAAFLLQCRQVFGNMDVLGQNIASPLDQKSTTGDVDFIPAVKRIIQQFIRYQMS